MKKIRFLLMFVVLLLPAFLLSHLLLSPQTHASGTSIIISEVQWGGTSADSNDEWIELHNPTSSPVNITGWSIADGVTILLNGTIPANGFYLLERTDDTTVSDIPADQIYTGSLTNSGETLTLRDAGNAIIDSANSDGGAWGAGTAAPNYLSMERISPTASDSDSNWVNNDTITRNGTNADGNPINGTPKQPNSAWNNNPPTGEADLVLTKTAPATANADTTLQYEITLANAGISPATNVLLTDTLPSPLTYLNDDSGFPISQPNPQTIVWQIGTVPTDTIISFHLNAAIPANASGAVTNQIVATTSTTETNTANNQSAATTNILAPDGSIVLIDAILYDGLVNGDNDEAVALLNAGTSPANISHWQLTDGGSATASLPENTTLQPHERIWLAKNALAFAQSFGFLPHYELEDSHPTIPNLSGSWPGYSNTGDEVALFDGDSNVVDTLVYEDGNTSQSGWNGTAVQPFSTGSASGANGQILYRKRDQTTNQPVPDTHTAADWAQDPNDIINGRKVRYPGWDLDTFFYTNQFQESANLTIAVAPDNAFETIKAEIDSAQISLQIEALTFENAGILNALLSARQRGVAVTILLEGGPSGGIPDQEKYICQQLENAGAQCWFMISDSDNDIYDRYSFLHAKFIIVDGERVVISSENLSPNSLPDDDKSDGTFGRRGIVLVTDAQGVVDHVTTLFQHDLAPFDGTSNSGHRDIFRWQANHPTWGAPPVDYQLITESGGITYTVRYPNPVTYNGNFAYEIVQSPENSLRTADSLLGLINQAGNGDTVLAQQLNERTYWGSSTSNPTADPNLRLEAMISAARRGATVRILLDQYFATPTEPNGNRATCDYVLSIARTESLKLDCSLGNPTGLGIHNKMFLVELNGNGYIHVGSINGTEQSSKGNRELALQVQSNQAYNYLATMFEEDWVYYQYIPLLFNQYIGPANHLLISELLYNPFGNDDAEFVELYNPLPMTVDLSGYSIGDAVSPDDFEDVLRFPDGTLFPSQTTLVIATNATTFAMEYGFNPDFEMYNSDDAVPDLIDDPNWGDPNAKLQLGNTGDELLLRNPDYNVIDVVTYGTGSHPMVTTCAPVATNTSLERFPFFRDTNNCAADFRERFPPQPGELP